MNKPMTERKVRRTLFTFARALSPHQPARRASDFRDFAQHVKDIVRELEWIRASQFVHIDSIKHWDLPEELDVQFELDLLIDDFQRYAQWAAGCIDDVKAVKRQVHEREVNETLRRRMVDPSSPPSEQEAAARGLARRLERGKGL